jgi:ABC-type sugar transport system ATPase subunit
MTTRAPDGLSLQGVRFERGGQLVLDDISFELESGRLLAVIGLSGAGKSTLLSLIAGFERPTAGSMQFAGRDLTGLAPVDRSIGMSFDDAALHEHLSVRENLDAAAMPRREPAERRRARVQSLAENLGIAPLLERLPSTLSAGERRRAAVGRAFIRGGSLVLLDEPFANLDRGNRFAIRQAVRELQRVTGATTIVVTHDPTDALAIADDFLVLVNGRARAFGPAVEISARPPDLEVAQLVDDLGMHAIELDALGRSSDCAIEESLRLRIVERAGGTPSMLGFRPWHVRIGSVPREAITIRARVLAHEPAGVFTDIILQRSAGRALRARIPNVASDVDDRRPAPAQELPIGSTAVLSVQACDTHLFVGPWPGRRVGSWACPNPA